MEVFDMNSNYLNKGTQNYTTIEYLKDEKFNAPNDYKITNSKTTQYLSTLHFQEGAIKDVGVNGIFMEDLINICIDRLEHYQKSDFACKENMYAIHHLNLALEFLNKRTNDRIKRGVQGTYKK
jgi:hypothetical protein